MKIKRLGRGDMRIAQQICNNLLTRTDEEQPLSIDHFENFITDERSYLFAAFVHDNVVGFLLAYTFPSFYANGNMAYLYDIEVLEGFRRRGIGKSLINEMMTELRSHQVAEIWLGTAVQNIAAQSLFTSTGAQKEEEKFYEYIYTL
jgi:ribosomal protein S18 acetylase RimI-like enzyme